MNPESWAAVSLFHKYLLCITDENLYLPDTILNDWEYNCNKRLQRQTNMHIITFKNNILDKYQSVLGLELWNMLTSTANTHLKHFILQSSLFWQLYCIYI